MNRPLPLVLAALALLLAGTAGALTYHEAKVTCPLDGTVIAYDAMGSGTSFGQRLDLMPIGPIDATPPLPKCPEDHFIVFEEALSPAELAKVKALVATAKYRALAEKGPEYGALALIFETLGRPDEMIAFAWLRASWQTEGDAKANRRFLAASLDRYRAALKAELPLERRFQVGLIAGELERRLGQFDAAAKRFGELEALPFANAAPFDRIVARQKALIAEKDSAPHPIPKADQK